MNDLNDIVWSTAKTKPMSISNNCTTLVNNENTHIVGPNLFSSRSPHGVSLHNGTSIFASHEQRSSTVSKSTFSSDSPKSYSSNDPLTHRASRSKINTDPFENLVNLGTTRKNSTAILSLEEQRKLVLGNKLNPKPNSETGRSPSPANRQFWEQLDSKSNLTPRSAPLTPTRSSTPLSDNIGFTNMQQKSGIVDPFEELLGPSISTKDKQNIFPSKNDTGLNSSKPLAVMSTSSTANLWNLDFLEQSSNRTKTPSTSQVNDPFGLDAFIGPRPESLISKTNKPPLPKRNSNPLGVLASPVVPKIELNDQSSDEEVFIRERNSLNDENGCISSVDPSVNHLIAKVMEMGFDYEQARSALELSGNNFQIAIDTLIDNRNTEDTIARRKQINAPPLPKRPQVSRNNSDKGDYGRSFSAWKSENSDSRSNNQRQEYGQSPGFDMVAFQNRKEKFISSASIIGASVLSKANMFMKQASEKIRESIDEIQQRNEAPQEDGGFKRTGKPRWLQSHSEDDSSDDDMDQNTYHKYKEEFTSERSSRFYDSFKQPQPPKDSINGVHKAQSHDSLRFRRPPPRPPVSLKNREANKTPVSTKPPITSQLKRLPRSVVSATVEQIRLSENQKIAGNEKFKLGQFGDAEEFYSKAIAALPPKHDNLIPLYNNRAASRIKVGDYNGAITDCDKVVELIRDDYIYSSSSDPINFKEQLIKAIIRRASANESKEKYEAAEKDFNKVIAIDSNNRNGLEGARRCQKAIKLMSGETAAKSSISIETFKTSTSGDLFSFEQQSTANAPTYSTTFGAHLDEFGFATVTSPTMSASIVTKEDIDKSEAVSRLRAQYRSAELEEAEKLRIIDIVEERLNQWKSNKIGNLRAMLASLDIILWPELNWKACGLQDLIQPSQVKSKYIRAIAKLHPDKLSTNESVEHKLLARGIFSILNEAWDQFKAQNGL